MKTPKVFFALLLLLLNIATNNTFSQNVHYGQYIRGAIFSDNDQMLATIDNSGYVKLWQLPALGLTYSEFHFWLWPTDPADFSFSKDGKWITGGNRVTVLFSIEQKKEYDIDIVPDNARFSCDDKSVIVTVAKGNSVSVKKIALDAPKIIPEKDEISFKAKIGEYSSNVILYEFLPDQYVYMTRLEPTVYFVKKGTKKPYATITINKQAEQPDYFFTLSKDRKYLISATGEVYDISTDMPQKLSDFQLTGNYNLDYSFDYPSEFNFIVSEDKVYIYSSKIVKTYSTSGQLEKEEPFETCAKKLFIVEKLDYNIRLYQSGQKASVVLNENPFAVVLNYARIQDKENTLVWLKKCLTSEFKPNLNLVAADSLFLFLTDTPEWQELMNGKWYSPYEEKVMEGEKLFGENKLDEALKAFSEAIALDPGKESAYEGRAFTMVQMKKLWDAEIDCDKCLQINPKNLNCLKTRADLREKAGKNIKAADDYMTILALDNSNKRLHFKVAKLLLYDGSKFDKVREHFREYEKNYLLDDEACMVKAEIASRMGDKSQICDAYRDAVYYNPKDEYFKKAIDCMLGVSNFQAADRLVEYWLKTKPGYALALSYKDKTDAAQGKGVINDPTKCSACKGSGKISSDATCNVCFGKGGVVCRTCGGRRFVYNSKGQSSYCDACHGEGTIRCYKCYGQKSQINVLPCKECGGKGKK